MRGQDYQQSDIFSYLSPEQRVRLRRLREYAQLCAVEVTPTGNRIGNRNECQGDIIHAEGVRVDFLSSAPQARAVPGTMIWCREARSAPTVFGRGVRSCGADAGSIPG